MNVLCSTFLSTYRLEVIPDQVFLVLLVFDCFLLSLSNIGLRLLIIGDWSGHSVPCSDHCSAQHSERRSDLCSARRFERDQWNHPQLRGSNFLQSPRHEPPPCSCLSFSASVSSLALAVPVGTELGWLV